MTSFDFNTGEAARLIMSSRGNAVEIARRMPSWNKVTQGGRKVVSPGLVERRAQEMQMFNAPSASLNQTIKGMQRTGRGQAPMSITTGATNITVNGVPTERQNAVGQEVARAMRRPVKTILEEVKAARSFESRLGMSKIAALVRQGWRWWPFD